MTEWVDFGIVGDNLVEHLLGSYTNLAIIVIVIFLLIQLTIGIELKYAIPLCLPLVGLFALSGWLGETGWILNASLMIVGFVYSFAIIRLFGGG